MGLDIAQAAEATRIRRHYLEALEQGEIDLLPSPVQVRGFVRAYATFLGLDASELLALIEPKKTPDQLPEDRKLSESGEPIDADTNTQPNEQASFSAIGDVLRARRELLDLNHTEIAGQVHIPEHYLAFMEAGEFERFPSPTQARGMLDLYAEFLGLESEELLLPYADVIQQRFQARRQARPAFSLPQGKIDFDQFKRLKLPPWAKRALSPDLLVGVLFTLGLLTFFVWGIGRISAVRAQSTLEPTAPPLGEVAADITTLPDFPTASLLPGEEGGTPVATEAALVQETPDELNDGVDNSDGVNLRLLASRRVWVRISVDGQVAFEGRLAPQDPQTFSGGEEVVLYTGDAGSIQVFLNGENLGVIGVVGEVVSLVFTREGRATPTPMPTPTQGVATPTETLQPTEPPTPTQAVDDVEPNP
jgi:cytoskeletal protein RodZ